MDIVLLKNLDGKVFYWSVVHKQSNTARIIKGLLGNLHEIEKIKSGRLKSLDEALVERRNQLIQEGYEEVEYHPYDKILSVNLYKWNYTTLPKKFDDAIGQLSDEINEFLFERGLTYQDSFVEVNEEYILIRLLTLDADLSEALIRSNFAAKIKSFQNSINDYNSQKE